MKKFEENGTQNYSKSSSSTSKKTNSPSGFGSTPVTLTFGEHISAVWCDEYKEKLQWYLGIVSKTVDSNNSDNIKISYLYRSGQSAST